MGCVGDLAKTYHRHQPGHAQRQPHQHHYQHPARQVVHRVGRHQLVNPDMTQQAVQHPGQPAKQARATKQVLGEVGDQAEQQAQADQVDAALAHFNPAPQLPVPHAVHGNVQETEVDQHRREQSPPLPRCQAIRQRCELDVLPVNAEIDKSQRTQGRQVVAQLRDGGHDQAQQ